MPGISNPVLRGFMAAREESQNIQTARIRNKLMMDKYATDKKYREAQIDKLASDRQITRQKADTAKKAINLMMSSLKNQSKINDMQIDQAEDQNKSVLQNYAKELYSMVPQFSYSVDENGEHYTMGAKLQENKTPEPKATDIDQSMGVLKNGGVYDKDGAFMPFESRKDAVRYANRKLGAGWETKFSDADKIISSQFGPDPDQFGKILKQKNITSMRQAYDMLTNSYGMSPELAQSWLKENN